MDTKKFTIDGYVTQEVTKILASGIKNIPDNNLEQFYEGFDGTRPFEFYQGLLSGYANMYQVINSRGATDAAHYASQFAMFVANHIIENYLLPRKAVSDDS